MIANHKPIFKLPDPNVFIFIPKKDVVKDNGM